MVATPECDKLLAAKDKAQIIGEFLEWLQSGEADDSSFKRSIFLASYGINSEEWDSRKGRYELLPEEEWNVSEKRIDCFRYNTEKLLAKFFGIDTNKLEEERRAMLEELQK